MTLDTYMPAVLCDICDCRAEPEVSFALKRDTLHSGLKYLTVCSTCADDYDEAESTDDLIECANCSAHVPSPPSEWSTKDPDSGEVFCLLCSGLKGFYEAYPECRPTRGKP